MAEHETQPTPLTDNGVLLHIGPHKTGTAALQSALDTSSDALEQAGVLTPDPLLQYRGATALTGWNRGAMELGEIPPEEDWDRLDAWVRNHPSSRVVLSSEWFDDCTTEMITRIHDSWGERLGVMVTVRSLERRMPSTWQQAVKTGAQYTYLDWLEPLLKGPEDPPNRRAHRFWFRHDDAALAQRWAEVVGVANVVVVVVDERQPELLFRRTEDLLRVPSGTITPGPTSNRSLTLPEIVAVRAMYAAVLPTDSARQAHKWLRRGAVKYLVEERVPPKGEPRLTTPAAKRERMREISRDVRDRLIATGVPIVGDPSVLLAESPIPADEPTQTPETIDPQIAALLVAGLYRPAADDVARLTAGRQAAREQAQHLMARVKAGGQGAQNAARGWRAKLRSARAKLPRRD